MLEVVFAFLALVVDVFNVELGVFFVDGAVVLEEEAVQVVTLALAVVTPPLYKLQVTTAPLTGVDGPPGLLDNGWVPFLGKVAASKNLLAGAPEYVGPGEMVKS